MNTPLRALFVEDRESDVQLVARILRDAGFELTSERVENDRQMRGALSRNDWDIIFSDYLMPQFTGPEALKVLQGSGLDIPFIIVSGSIGEETAVEAMALGAGDYVMKDNLRRLVPAVRRELDEKRVRDKRAEAEQELQKIAWLLTRKLQKKDFQPPYGNLVGLDTPGLILNAVGTRALVDIASDAVSLLETSCAIYEKNGDYAAGILSSGWCRFLFAASRERCHTKDNKEALASGKWGCHESCWKASKKSIETGQPVDIDCFGGLRILALPIRARGEVIGSINLSYGNPPLETAELEEIGRKINADTKELRKIAQNYNPRPPFIIDLANERLVSSARLIGLIVERWQAEEELKGKIRELEQANRLMFDREDRILELKEEVKALKEQLAGGAR